MVEATRTNVASDEPWTVRRIIDWTTAHLQKHGSDTPRLDTEILLSHARGCKRIELYTRFDEALSEVERRVMRELVRRRARAEPVAYLVGHREFFGLEFRVTPDVLVPRPDTETLVMELLDLAKSTPEPRILDIGTGSGCIGIAIAVNNRQARLTATDVSAGALDIARENAESHDVSTRIRFLIGDVFAPLEPSEQFDLIVSNPPYVADHEMETLQADVRLHEPQLALSGGPDGLSVLRQLIENAPRHLADAGHLLVEISPEQAAHVCELLQFKGSYTEINSVKDLAGKVRVIRARKHS